MAEIRRTFRRQLDPGWDRIEAARSFKKEDPHAEAMDVLRADMKDTFRYSQWKSRRDALPETWKELRDHMRR